VIRSEPAKVLIADDEEDTRQFLIDFLKELGHVTLAVSSGREAIETARRELPDVILLDVMMPELSGLEVCQVLKEAAETRDIPIIFVTARAGINDQVIGLHAGAHDYINKPYRITELATRLNAAVRVKRLQDELKERNREMEEFSRSIETNIIQPLENSSQAIQQMLKQRFSRHTRESLAKADRFINESLEHARSLSKKPK
jgi:two-component system, sensor histidine kinase and response regulator